MKWEAEKWRKLYRRVDATWLKLPLLARGLGSELLKYADDDGRIAVMADEDTGEALCRLMGAHKTERKTVSDLAAKLLADGYIVRETETIVIRNFTRAQCRSSNAERQARYRKRHENDASEEDGNVTSGEQDDGERDVTSNGQSNGRVTRPLPNEVTDRALSLSLSSSEISGSLSADQIPEDPVNARAYASAVPAQAALFADAAPVSRNPAAEVFAAWLAGWREYVHHGREPLLTKDRQTKIRARIAEGYDPEDLKAAVRGIWQSEWHREKQQTDLALALQDGAHLDRFRVLDPLTKAPPPAPAEKLAWMNQLPRRTITLRDVEALAADEPDWNENLAPIAAPETP